MLPQAPGRLCSGWIPVTMAAISWCGRLPKMAHINDVCDYIIVKLTEDRTSLNVLKLHKLLYYVQAWNLAFGKGRLFDGRFQAWVHGPVSREIYDRFVNTKSMYSPVAMNDVRAGFDPQSLPDEERAHVDAVLEVYGPFTGDQLEEMTHREDPWLTARRGVPAAARSETSISEEEMGEYYRQRL